MICLEQGGLSEGRESSSFSFSCPFLASPNLYIHLSHWSPHPTDPVPIQTPAAKGTAPRPSHSEGTPLGLTSASFFPPPPANPEKLGQEGHGVLHEERQPI